MLLGLSGRKQSGKSTLAKYLWQKHDFHEMSWAEPLKEIIGRQLLGLTREQVYGSSKDKETVDAFWGKSPRHLLQVIGTDCFRKQVDPDFWVKICLRNIDELHRNQFARAATRPEKSVVFSDCRFPNELKAIESRGGVNIRVVREDWGVVDNHESETALDDYPFTEIITAKSGDVESLKLQLDLILSRYNYKKNAI